MTSMKEIMIITIISAVVILIEIWLNSCFLLRLCCMKFDHFLFADDYRWYFHVKLQISVYPYNLATIFQSFMMCFGIYVKHSGFTFLAHYYYFWFEKTYL